MHFFGWNKNRYVCYDDKGCYKRTMLRIARLVNGAICGAQVIEEELGKLKLSEFKKKVDIEYLILMNPMQFM